MAIALDEAVQSGRVQHGDLILLIVFGAGLTWGAAVMSGNGKSFDDSSSFCYLTRLL